MSVGNACLQVKRRPVTVGGAVAHPAAVPPLRAVRKTLRHFGYAQGMLFALHGSSSQGSHLHLWYILRWYSLAAAGARTACVALPRRSTTAAKPEGTTFVIGVVCTEDTLTTKPRRDREFFVAWRLCGWHPLAHGW